MTMHRFLIATLFCIPLLAFGQKKPAANAVGIPSVTQPVWTKRVSRLISIVDTGNVEKRKLRDESNGVSLAELLTDNALKGKIRAFSAADSKLIELLAPGQLHDIIDGRPDTIEIEDPISGKVFKKVIKRDFNYNEVTHFRILEEWSFDRETAKTNIQIIGIAPVKDVYGDDGTFRGRMSLYWLRYDDVKNILAQFERTHPNANIALGVWTSYFTENEK